MADSFSPGDVVVLKSGGPKMTVGYAGPENVTCFWYENGAIVQREIPMATVQKASVDEVKRGSSTGGGKLRGF